MTTNIQAKLMADFEAKHRMVLSLPRCKNGWTTVKALAEFKEAKAARDAALAALRAGPQPSRPIKHRP